MSFERSGGSTRSFDISVLTNNDIGYTFSSIEKNEYQKLYDYFKNKKITVKAQGSGGKGGTLNFDEDDKVDHYLEGKNTVRMNYRISSYSFRGNYPFLNLEIQRSQYIKVRKLFKGGNYSRA